jgi:hypothetical protein
VAWLAFIMGSADAQVVIGPGTNCRAEATRHLWVTVLTPLSVVVSSVPTTDPTRQYVVDVCSVVRWSVNNIPHRARVDTFLAVSREPRG